jgi:murein DD-endopeptidase MepM/ murein hydrolase activator NlpD
VIRARRRAILLTLTLLPLAGLAAPARAAPASVPPLDVAWHGAPRMGEVVWVVVPEARAGTLVEGDLAGRPLTFFPYAGGVAALVGFDVDAPAGAQPWRITVDQPGRPRRTATGTVHVEPRQYTVQRLTLPDHMVDLDPATERRAVAEAEQLRSVFRMITGERLWRGRFAAPVVTSEPGTGFGARRIINGKPRAPHTGIDFAVPRGTPVLAVNDGRVALVAEHFFPGRLVVIDHGLGLYTLYFHLDTVAVTEGQRVTRGQPIATVGATGRATGPHLHFGAHIGAARIDPASLLGLTVAD